MKENTIKVVARIIGGKAGNDAILFIPEIPANYGTIMSYMHIGQHGEASVEFYSGLTRQPRTEQERQDIADLLAEYANIVDYYDDATLKVQKRINWNIVRKGWAI